MYRYMAYNMFLWCYHFGVKNGFFAKKFLKKLCNELFFLEAFFVTPLFLDTCIEVFGAWVNHKNILNLDIFKEDIAVFAKDVGFFFNKKTLSWRTLSSSTFFHILIIDINVGI